jgi:hypothetical protein
LSIVSNTPKVRKKYNINNISNFYMSDFDCPPGFEEVSEFTDLQLGKYLFFYMNNGSRCPFVADIRNVDEKHIISYVVAGTNDYTIHTHNNDSWRETKTRAFRRVKEV